MRNSIKNRCSLAGGTKAIAITSILLAILSGCGHGRMDTDTDPPDFKVEEVSVCTGTSTTVTTTATTSKRSTTTMSTTTSATTTTAATTLKMNVSTMMPNATIEYDEFSDINTEYDDNYENDIEVTTEIPVDNVVEDNTYETELPITEQEFILLCNLVSHEAGSSWLTEYDRACIVAATMNRVADSRFPNTIDEVVHQKGQMFDVPYYRVDYSTLPREEIDNAIYAYFNGKYEFGNFNSWCGDGTKNYFYTQ